MIKNKTKSIRHNKERANIIRNLFYVLIGFNLISGYFCYDLYSRYHDADLSTLSEIQVSGRFETLMLIGGLEAIIEISVVVCFLNWFRRGYYNLHMLSDSTPDYDDDMAVWSFIIPFVNFIRPYSIMNEIYDGTHSKAEQAIGQRIEKNTGAISIWWGLFIFLGIIIALLNNVSGEESIQEIITGMLFLSITSLLTIPRALGALYVIKTVSDVETILYDNRHKLDSDVPADSDLIDSFIE